MPSFQINLNTVEIERESTSNGLYKRFSRLLGEKMNRSKSKSESQISFKNSIQLLTWTGLDNTRSPASISFTPVLGHKASKNDVSTDDLHDELHKLSLPSIRWKMLRSILKMSDNTPAKFIIIQHLKETTAGFMGRPKPTLPLLIDKDLKKLAEQMPTIIISLKLPYQLQSIDDLKKLEKTLKDQKIWKTLMQNIHVLDEDVNDDEV
jgi:hypothetical protein